MGTLDTTLEAATDAPTDATGVVIQAQLRGELAQMELEILKAVKPNWYLIATAMTVLFGLLGFIYNLAMTPVQEAIREERAQIVAISQTLVQMQTQAAQTNELVAELSKRFDK